MCHDLQSTIFMIKHTVSCYTVPSYKLKYIIYTYIQYIIPYIYSIYTVYYTVYYNIILYIYSILYCVNNTEGIGHFCLTSTFIHVCMCRTKINSVNDYNIYRGTCIFLYCVNMRFFCWRNDSATLTLYSFFVVLCWDHKNLTSKAHSDGEHVSIAVGF